jgi:outer membrane receptor protein involved in Fe transport
LDNRLSYTSGIFLSREDIDNHLTGNLVGFNGYSYKSDVSTLIPKVLASQSDMRNESFAVFAQGTYEFYDWFQLTLGTRYSLEKREREATIYEADCDAIVADALVDNVTDLCAFDVLGLEEPDGFYANPPSFLPVRLVEEFETLEGDVITAVDGKVAEDEDWSEWTPTITSSFNIPGHFLQDTAIDSTLIYLTYSKGFKSGGFEMKGLEVFEFKPEKVTNYELGIKIDAFDERLRLNSAFYYMDYDDIQIRITEQGRSFADILIFIDNAGAATIQGFELEMTALPLKNVVLTATASYTDASYDEFIASDVDTDVTPPVQTQVDRSNEDFAAIPKLTYSLAASVTLPTSIGNLTPSLSMYFRDNLYTGLDASAWDPEFRDLATLDDVTLWNLRLGFIPANSDKLQLWFYVDNLTDEDYFQGGFSNTESLGAGSYVKGTPRSYGLEASYSF